MTYIPYKEEFFLEKKDKVLPSNNQKDLFALSDKLPK